RSKRILDQVRSIPSPLRFIHGESETLLHLNDLSNGTRAWMVLIDHLLDVLKDGTVLVVDEVDTSLHTRLAARLIEMFKNPETNPQNAQLIFATQDATLLGRDLGEDILPRDTVWFVKKDRAGMTTLYALSDFKPRKDENTERRYLSGSYGAVARL